MKNLIIIIALITPFLSKGQDLTTLIKEYEEYCNEIVLDTVTQEGLIFKSYKVAFDSVQLKSKTVEHKQDTT